MTSLKYLKIHNNELVGTVPDELGGILTLKELLMYQNLLTGTIEAESGLCNLKHASILNDLLVDCGGENPEVVCKCCDGNSCYTRSDPTLPLVTSRTTRHISTRSLIDLPSKEPSDVPSDVPSKISSDIPSKEPSVVPSSVPSGILSTIPSDVPSEMPSNEPSKLPSGVPAIIMSNIPSDVSSYIPSMDPSEMPNDVLLDKSSDLPSDMPSVKSSDLPSYIPSDNPSDVPSGKPSMEPIKYPSSYPSISTEPTVLPTASPSSGPTTSLAPTLSPPEELVTTFVSNNGSSGNMFDIKALQALSVVEMDINTGASGSVTATVYTKAGSYPGFEHNSAEWTPIASTSVTSQGQDNPTPIPEFNTPVLVSSGATQAFYVTVSDIKYTNGSSESSIFAQNTHMQIFEGIGIGGESFGYSTFRPRVWNGAIRYRTVQRNQISYSLIPPIPSSSPSVIGSFTSSVLSTSVTTSANSPIQSGVSSVPSDVPSAIPSDVPSDVPSMIPSELPSMVPSDVPSAIPINP